MTNRDTTGDCTPDWIMERIPAGTTVPVYWPGIGPAYPEEPDGRTASQEQILCYLAFVRATGTCGDCGVNVHRIREIFMVPNEVWAQAVAAAPMRANDRGVELLCIGCLEKRLGRTLHQGDLRPYNGGKSARWLDRLDRTEPGR